MSGLFTVLIAEKEHIDAIRQENKLFFEPFLENKELAFCYWNPEGQNLEDSVPGLHDVVGRRKEWRAVIISNSTPETLKMRNPFDIVDQGALPSLTEPHSQPELQESWDEWEQTWVKYYADAAEEKERMYKRALELPLQKLSTWLCFRPENYILNEVRETQDLQEWALGMVNGEEVKPSVRLEVLERKQYKLEQRMKECIRREFAGGQYLNVAYPAEVHCIAIRTAENNFFDPDTYWTVRPESAYSKFVDRNMYFDKMRFMVFDLLPRTHRDFRTDRIRFMASVLIFATNPVPGSAMKARRLYQLETETDDTPLCTMVTSYDRKLEATAEIIKNEMDKIRSEIPGKLTDKDAEELFCKSTDVAVVLDESCKPDKVYVEKDYGLFFDSPENERNKWRRDYSTSEKTLTYIVKQQSRSVRKSVTQMHLASDITDVNVSRLTPLQVEDVRDYTNTAENEMIDSIPPDITDISGYTQRMQDASDNVKKVIAQRMTKKTTLSLMGVCLGLYLACFLPFLFSNTNTSKNTTTAVLLSGILVLVLGVIMFAALFFLRKRVVNAVKAYNNTVHGVMEEIYAALKRFSKYLSASCNVRRGHKVQYYTEKNLDEYTLGLRIRKKHLEDIRKKRAYLAEDYQDYFADRSFCDETMSRPYEYDFDQKVEYDYPAPFLAGDRRQIEFISNGNFVAVPSSYVTKILVRMEGIYEV